MTGKRLIGAAAVVAALTMLSRLAGFARILVFNWSVGPTYLGNAYTAANTIPNIIFELVAGGALASLVVPMLAGAVARQDKLSVARTVSALLSWVIVLLVPAAVLVALLARPLVGLLMPGQPAGAVDAGTDMLRVFAPQLPLYGIGIVLTGTLQTYRRFAWPVIAPLLSSLTVMTVYVTFGVLAGRGADLGQVDDADLWLLSGGTTLAVAVLTLSLLIPLRRLDVRIRPTLRFDAHEVRALQPLVIAGIVTVGSQQLVLGLAIALSGYAGKGAVVVYSLAQTIFLLPWAILAVPVATTAYPAMAETGGAKDAAGFAKVLAPALRTVVVLTSLGAAALVVLAEPVAVILAELSSKPPDIGQLAGGITWFAPGLLGYGLFALLSRALYAGERVHGGLGDRARLGRRRRQRRALAVALPLDRRVAALAAANSIGMLVLAAALVLAVRAKAGGDAVAGSGRTAAAAVASATVAATAALTLRNLVWGGGTPDVSGAVAQGMLCGVAVAVVFLAGVAVTDRRTLQRLIHRRG